MDVFIWPFCFYFVSLQKRSTMKYDKLVRQISDDLWEIT